MPFGLTNVPATFQRLINNVLRLYLDVYYIYYLDDILVYLKNEEQYVVDVTTILEALQKARLLLKPEKCYFYVKEVVFLGYIVTTTGLAINPKKVEAILEQLAPTNIKEVQSFLGFANFYRRFIKDYLRIAGLLIELTYKDKEFKQTERAQTALDALKQAFVTKLVLVLFDLEKKYRVETDSLDYAIGAILSQSDKQGRQQLVVYYSRKLSAVELNYNIYNKELLAIIDAIREQKVYLEGSAYEV